MDIVIEDFLTGEHSGATHDKDKKKATLMCRGGKLVSVRDDGTVLVGDALRIMKFSGRFGVKSEEGSGPVAEDESDSDPEIFMEIRKKDGTSVSVDEAIGASRGGGMDNFWSHGHRNVEMVRRRGHYSDEFQVSIWYVYVGCVLLCIVCFSL